MLKSPYSAFSKTLTVSVALLVGSTSASSAFETFLNEASFVDDTGAAIRIEAGDELRIATQEISAAACHLHNNVSTDMSAQLLMDGVEKFDAMLDALVNGNPDFGIFGAEEGLKMQRLLADLDTQWQDYRAAALRVHAAPDDTEALGFLYNNATAMLDSSYNILTQLEGKYSNPAELLYADAMLIKISGRQAMLSQRIAFLACKKWSGAAGDDYVEKLRDATNQYSAAMSALMFGAPEMGINPPPTDEINEALSAISGDTALIEAKMESLFETGELDPDLAADLYDILSEKMRKLQNISHLYAVYSKRVY